MMDVTRGVLHTIKNNCVIGLYDVSHKCTDGVQFNEAACSSQLLRRVLGSTTTLGLLAPPSMLLRERLLASHVPFAEPVLLQRVLISWGAGRWIGDHFSW